jgi:nitrogen fixation-related uncharacterized protein
MDIMAFMWTVKRSQLWKETLAGRIRENKRSSADSGRKHLQGAASPTLRILQVWRDKTFCRCRQSAMNIMAFMWTVKRSQLWKETLVGRIRMASAGVARQNTCFGNIMAFMWRSSAANSGRKHLNKGREKPRTCRENKECGIAYFENSAGVARQNICIGNDKTSASAMNIMAFMWAVKRSQLWKETLAGRTRSVASPTLRILQVWRDKTSASAMEFMASR